MSVMLLLLSAPAGGWRTLRSFAMANYGISDVALM